MKMNTLKGTHIAVSYTHLGYQNFNAANLQYGKLAKHLSKEIHWNEKETSKEYMLSLIHICNELENADSVIRIDGTAGKMRSYTIKFSTPTEFTDELGDHFPGQPIDTMRASSVDFEYYMRNDAAKRLRDCLLYTSRCV